MNTLNKGDKVRYVGDNKAMKDVRGTVIEVLPIGTSLNNLWVAWITDAGQEARSTSENLVKI